MQVRLPSAVLSRPVSEAPFAQAWLWRGTPGRATRAALCRERGAQISGPVAYILMSLTSRATRRYCVGVKPSFSLKNRVK